MRMGRFDTSSKQHAVEPRDMVGDEQGASPLRQVFEPAHVEPVEELAQDPDDAADRRLRNQAHDVDRHGDGAESGRQEDRRGRPVQLRLHEPEQSGSHDHEAVGDEVGRGQNRAAGLHLAALLQVALERNIEQPGRNAQRKEPDARPAEGTVHG